MQRTTQTVVQAQMFRSLPHLSLAEICLALTIRGSALN
jgi:hypothetical protein